MTITSTYIHPEIGFHYSRKQDIFSPVTMFREIPILSAQREWQDLNIRTRLVARGSTRLVTPRLSLRLQLLEKKGSSSQPLSTKMAAGRSGMLPACVVNWC